MTAEVVEPVVEPIVAGVKGTGEAYLDVVWKQFRKNRPAFWSLWIVAGLFFLAIFAPLIASNRPLVFHDYERDVTAYPWVQALFNPDQPVDYVFNMALVGFVPWLILAVIGDIVARQRGVPGRWRVGGIVAAYIAITILLCGLFRIDALRPSHETKPRDFSEEEFRQPETSRSIYAPIPFGPIEQDLNANYEPPLFRLPEEQWRAVNDGFVHLLGTDDTGRDVLVRMLYGTRISMTVGLVAEGIAVTIGVIVGAIAGYFGGKWDLILSRIIEIVLLFPTFFLILALVGLIGPSIYLIMVVIGLTAWPSIARLTRGEVLKQRALDYTLAAQALGASNLRIIFRHVLPNSLSPALVAVPFGVAGAIVTEAALSLLGVGVPLPTPTWGTLLRLGSLNYSYWWLVVIPSAAIFITVTVFNLVGSGLRDAMDPRLRI
jgi:peptide/nickel transport system permease protein